MKFFSRALICLSRRVLRTTLSIWPACLRLAGLVCWWKGTLKLHWKGNRSGGLKHIQLCPRSCKANANESWMLWEMCFKNSVKTYIERPKGSLDNAFYLKGIRTFRTHGRFLPRRFVTKVEIVENTSTHQIVPKILLSLMSTILSPQCNNETEQQSFSANSICLFFFEPRGP